MRIVEIMVSFENAFTDWKEQQLEEFEGNKNVTDYLNKLEYDFIMVKNGAESVNEDYLDNDSLDDAFEDIIDSENDYNIDRDEFLQILEDYDCSQYSEISGIYDDEENLGFEFMNGCYDIPKELENYIDYEKFGSDLLQDEGYQKLNDGRIVCMNM